MMSISVEAAEARDSLSDDKELINTYEVEWHSLIIIFTGMNLISLINVWNFFNTLIDLRG